MATILQVTPLGQIQPSRQEQDADGNGSEYFSAFQEILEFVCSRIENGRSTNTDQERRTLPRTKMALRARCSGAWGDSPCLVSDISEGGMAFVCGHPHEVDDDIRLTWYALEGPIEIECIVRHVTGANIGVEFLNLTQEQRHKVLTSLHITTPTRPKDFAMAA
jgi:hypothetical protein